MFEGIRNWIVNNQRASFLIGLALLGSVAIILATGSFFNVDLGRISADATCGVDFFCSSGQVCNSQETDCVDPDDPTAGSSGSASTTPCNPVSASSWTGGSNACKKEEIGPGVPPIPDNFLPHVTLQNSGGLPGTATSAPYGSADGYTCFEFTVPDGNAWAAFDATSGGTVPAPVGNHTLTGQFFNNCPWQVEMTGGAAGSPTAGNDYIFKTDGTIDEPIAGLDERISRGTTQLIPSCWNYAHIQDGTIQNNNNGGGGNGNGPGDVMDLRSSPFAMALSDYLGRFFGVRAMAAQAGCSGSYSISLNLSGFSAGRVEASLGWKHHDQVGTAPGSTTIQDGYNVVANTGRNCTQAPGEVCAGAGAGTSGGSGGTGGTNGPGPGGAFNCGTGERSYGCWCGEWGDAIWAQRHATAGHQCVPGYTLTPEYKQFLKENVPSFDGGGAPDGTTDGDIVDWSRTKVQAFIDIMGENFNDTGGKNCVPKGGDGSVDYDGIQSAYWAISEGGIGLSGNGSSAVGATCRLDISIDAASLTGICESGPSVRLDWNIPVGAVANGLVKRTDDGDGQFLTGIGNLQTNYIDSDVAAGHTYQYQHKVHASVASDPVDVVIDDDGTCRILGASPAPTTSVPPTPTTSAPSDTCGDSVCGGSETCSTCADDCGSCGGFCGDGVCGSNESCSSCASDCGTCSATCGDGVCSSGESPNSCADDCGSFGSSCGDNVCDNSESCSTCSGDCGTCGATGGQVSSAGQAQTGPGAAGFMAFMLSSVVALLYVSYTHTSLFRRREVQKVTNDSEGMDFRS